MLSWKSDSVNQLSRVALMFLVMMLQIWVPTNPRGAERLPPDIVTAETDLYLRRLWGLPSEVCAFFHSLIYARVVI